MAGHLRRRLRIGDWPSQVETVGNETAPPSVRCPAGAGLGVWRLFPCEPCPVLTTSKLTISSTNTVAAASAEPCIDRTNLTEARGYVPPLFAASNRASFGDVRLGEHGSHVLYPRIT
jgi:hypothetical protein